MKQILYMIGLTIALLSTSCAQQKEIIKGKIMKQSILMKKPSFNIRISCENSSFRVYLNGEQQFEDFSRLPIALDYPANGTIVNGENELMLLMDNNTKMTSKCKVTLFVREFNDFDSPQQDILTLSYDETQKTPLSDTTKEGQYSSLNHFNKEEKGDITILAPTINKQKKSDAYESDAQFIRLKFSLPNVSPRWRFMDGKPILKKPYLDLSLIEFKKLQKEDPKITKLIEINHQIYNAAKNKDLDKLVSFFTERNREMDTAFYHKSGEVEKELREGFLEVFNDSNMKLLERSDKKWKEHDLIFRVEENNKLAYILNLLSWNYIKGEGSRNFKIKFRWDGDKWILTR